MRIILVIILCLCTAGELFAAEDWAYELSPEAKQIYKKKIIQYPCENIPALLQQNKTQDLYYTIRDAGIFKTKSCGTIIQRHADQLKRMLGVKDAVAFYFYKLGDNQQLKILETDFDNEAKATGDYVVVDLFGYLDDWDISGVRLVRHAAYSDGAASELLCSAIMWRRYLFGEKSFKENWYKAGRNEKINQRILDYFYETCRVAP